MLLYHVRKKDHTYLVLNLWCTALCLVISNWLCLVTNELPPQIFEKCLLSMWLGLEVCMMPTSDSLNRPMILLTAKLKKSVKIGRCWHQNNPFTYRLTKEI